MEKQKIILDCDPGHDDAIAIMLAGKNPALDLLGITVVAGNQTLDKTVKNTLNVCQYLNLDIPVYAGCGRPMIRHQQMVASDIHGKTGLDGPTFGPLVKKAEKKHAVNFIIETVMSSSDDIIIVTTGPMTNVAMAMRMEPKIVPKIKGFLFMGGSYSNGNVTPAAEFNIITDGDAAFVVFDSGRPLTMVGLDVTRKVLCTPDVIDRMSKVETPAARLFVDLMNFFNKTQRETFGWPGGPVHDPVTIASLLNPALLTTKFVHAEVDIRSIQSYGRTNCDLFHYQKLEPNCNVAVDIDVERFWDLIEQALYQYS
ncbi:nucleoside hydrolase [Sediminispirochaeta bajacaliforniensis]|uniref:nucleoside hydrolase n=1 Tax=Sediminispirochaeta bajacaliforniensis TaxID=148 RepID=UPI0003695151|nr:nucleoside hydrolase [Sediminispirochaeta bajacaliforniensis]